MTSIEFRPSATPCKTTTTRIYECSNDDPADHIFNSSSFTMDSTEVPSATILPLNRETLTTEEAKRIIRGHRKIRYGEFAQNSPRGKDFESADAGDFL